MRTCDNVDSGALQMLLEARPIRDTGLPPTPLLHEMHVFAYHVVRSVYTLRARHVQSSRGFQVIIVAKKCTRLIVGSDLPFRLGS